MPSFKMWLSLKFLLHIPHVIKPIIFKFSLDKEMSFYKNCFAELHTVETGIVL